MARTKKIEKIDYEEVEKLAALGLTDEEIAEWLGICRATLHNYKTEDKKFLDTIKRGKLKADSKVIQSLYKKATELKDTTAMIFWLKNRRPDQWRDKQEIETNGNTKVDVIIK